MEDRIARIAARVARLPHDVDDVKQAARIAVWEAATDLGDTAGDGLLVQRAKWAAQNEAARLERSRHDTLPLDVCVDLPTETAAGPPLVDPVEVQAAVGRLPLRERHVIHHRYFAPAAVPTDHTGRGKGGFQPNLHGLSVRNTAAVLRLGVSQVKTAERHALGRLRGDLAHLGTAA